jgi:hypothetical protein
MGQLCDEEDTLHLHTGRGWTCSVQSFLLEPPIENGPFGTSPTYLDIVSD